MKEPILQGQDSALRHLKGVSEYVANLPEKERAQWWAGYLAAAVGCAMASIGPYHAQTVYEGIKLVLPEATKTN